MLIEVERFGEWRLLVASQRIEIVYGDASEPTYMMDSTRVANGWQVGFGPKRSDLCSSAAMRLGARLAREMVSDRAPGRNRRSFWIWSPSGLLYAPDSKALVIEPRHWPLLRDDDRFYEMVRLRRDGWIYFASTYPRARGYTPLTCQRSRDDAIAVNGAGTVTALFRNGA